MRTDAVRPACATLAGIALLALSATTAAQKPPAFQADLLWPKPLPNNWIIGSLTGVAVDRQNHIWMAHRLASLNTRTEAGLMADPVGAEYCCDGAPPVLEFDAAGALVQHWGGPGKGYDWPESMGGIAVDDQHVWITAAGPPEPAAAAAGATGVVAGGGRGDAPPPVLDAQVLKFTKAGAFVMQIGRAKDTGTSDSQTRLDRPVDVALDGGANEIYVADGGSHQRVIVFDASSGAYKRQWAGHGTPFTRLSSIAVSRDGMVYVGDRKNNRIQSFKKDGTFVAETLVSAKTLGNGSVWDLALSTDSGERWLFVADGQNAQVLVLARATMQVATTFGDGGRWPGRFYAVNSVAMDAKGTVYTGEGYEGKRLQRWTAK
jgi:DNA-binding beta-propeller fold protein YncE